MNAYFNFDSPVFVFIRTPKDKKAFSALKDKMLNATPKDEIILHDPGCGVQSNLMDLFIVPFLCVIGRATGFFIMEAATGKTAAQGKMMIDPQDGLGVIGPFPPEVWNEAMKQFFALEEKCAKLVERKNIQDQKFWKKRMALSQLKSARDYLPEHSSQLTPIIQSLENDEAEAKKFQSDLRDDCLSLSGHFAELADLLSQAKITKSTDNPFFLRSWHEAVAVVARHKLPQLYGVQVAETLLEEFENRTPEPADNS